MVLGLCGLLLTPILQVVSGGPAKTKHVQTKQVKAKPVKTKQVGLASWYGTRHQGRKTASGERFSRKQLTAAHRSLPLGTKVKVTNLRTRQQVVVKINDRGPYAGGNRIIDLSEGAAKRIGLLEHGTERVELVVVGNAS
jgi:rare lipoprotein A